MHPSLLPKYRGACPIQHAILNGEKQTGVSIIEISKNQFDAGPVLWQKKVPIDEKTRFLELQATLSTVGGEGLAHVLTNFESAQLLGVP